MVISASTIAHEGEAIQQEAEVSLVAPPLLPADG
jgi:hypothetical protein